MAETGRGGTRGWVLPALLGAVALTVAVQALWVHRTFIQPTRERTAPLSSQVGAAATTSRDYYVDFDGYYFVSYAREMVAKRTARVRWTDLDATPDGRPVHWSSLFPWWLIATASVESLVTQKSLAASIDSAAYYANPLLLFALAVALAISTRRPLGAGLAGAIALAAAGQPKLLEDFGYAKPDHHGLALAFAAATVVCAVRGSGGFGRDTSNSSRRWLIASGVSGGLGLWVGATQMSVVIAGIGVGAALALLTRRESDRSTIAHDLRAWAWSGAAVSLAAWAIEALPDSPRGGLGPRLEINHPLHALAWLGGGESLAALASWRRDGRWPATRPLAVAGGLLAAIALPVAVLFGPVAWYWPRDATMWNLHQRIAEFQPLLSVGGTLPELLLLLALPVLALGAGTGLVLTRKLESDERARLLVAIGPAWLLVPWVLVQMRWLGFLCVAAVAILVAIGSLERRRPGRRWLPALVAIAIAANAVPWLAHARQLFVPAPVVLQLDVALRDFAANLCPPNRIRRPIHVMTGPTEAAHLHFFGRCRGVGTPYWENVVGLRDTARFFAAGDDAEALEIARARRLDYVLVARDPSFAEFMVFTNDGASNAAAVSRSLAHRLGPGSAAPPWLSEVTVRGWPGGRAWRVYRVAELR